MNYKLAKQLKDAGFKQEGMGVMNDEFDNAIDQEAANWEHLYYPTLSELIEACGDRFGELSRTGERVNKWICYDYGCLCDLKSKGKTPEEAVANLWIKLNKKD